MCFSWNTKRKTFLLTNTFAGNNHTRASSFWQINNSCTFVSTFLCLCIFTGQRCTRSGADRWKHSIVLKPKTKNWNLGNTRKLPNIEVKKLSSWIMIESIIVLIGTHYDALEDQGTYLALNSGRRTLADDIWQLPIQIPERFLTQIQIQIHIQKYKYI